MTQVRGHSVSQAKRPRPDLLTKGGQRKSFDYCLASLGCQPQPDKILPPQGGGKQCQGFQLSIRSMRLTSRSTIAFTTTTHVLRDVTFRHTNGVAELATIGCARTATNSTFRDVSRCGGISRRRVSINPLHGIPRWVKCHHPPGSVNGPVDHSPSSSQLRDRHPMR